MGGSAHCLKMLYTQFDPTAETPCMVNAVTVCVFNVVRIRTYACFSLRCTALMCYQRPRS